MVTSIGQNIDIAAAHEVLKSVVLRTPLQFHRKLSEQFGCKLYLKREDLQVVRSYKIRGAYNLIQSLNEEQRRKGIVCASAGNHAQGVAFSCKLLNIHGVIYMPAITPKQKINQVKMFGGDNIEIVLIGDTYDDCQTYALAYAHEHEMVFIPPFDHPKIIEGQGTVAKEILEDQNDIDYIFVPVGGGGLIAGVSQYFQVHPPTTKTIPAQPHPPPPTNQPMKPANPPLLEKLH